MYRLKEKKTCLNLNYTWNYVHSSSIKNNNTYTIMYIVQVHTIKAFLFQWKMFWVYPHHVSNYRVTKENNNKTWTKNFSRRERHLKNFTITKIINVCLCVPSMCWLKEKFINFKFKLCFLSFLILKVVKQRQNINILGTTQNKKTIIVNNTEYCNHNNTMMRLFLFSFAFATLLVYWWWRWERIVL